eukprot:COSAG02_NODE_1767_length_11002_cov_41.487205_6_plen_107_part_00
MPPVLSPFARTIGSLSNRCGNFQGRPYLTRKFLLKEIRFSSFHREYSSAASSPSCCCALRVGGHRCVSQALARAQVRWASRAKQVGELARRGELGPGCDAISARIQ